MFVMKKYKAVSSSHIKSNQQSTQLGKQQEDFKIIINENISKNLSQSSIQNQRQLLKVKSTQLQPEKTINLQEGLKHLSYYDRHQFQLLESKFSNEQQIKQSYQRKKYKLKQKNSLQHFKTQQIQQKIIEKQLQKEQIQFTYINNQINPNQISKLRKMQEQKKLSIQFSDKQPTEQSEQQFINDSEKQLTYQSIEQQRQDTELVQVGNQQILYGLNEFVKKMQDLTKNASQCVQTFHKEYEKKINALDFSVFNKTVNRSSQDKLFQSEINKLLYNYENEEQFDQYEILGLIKKLKIFKNISEKMFFDLILKSKLIQAKQNQIFNVNENLIYIILSGSVEVFKISQHDGIDVKTILESKYDGEYFGDLQKIYEIFPYESENNFDIESNMQKYLKNKKSIKLKFTQQIYAKCSEDTLLYQLDSNLFIDNIFKEQYPRFKQEIQFLKNIDLFYIVPLFQLVKFQPDLIRQKYSLGQIVLNQGDKLNYLYFIYRGCVRVIYDDSSNYKLKINRKEDKLDYKKKFLIKTMAAGEYFGQRSVLINYEKDKKKTTFKYDQSICHLQVISDSPNLELILIDRNHLERFDCQSIFQSVLSQIIRSQEYDYYDKEEIVKNYLNWLQQNLKIEKAVRNNL